MSKEQNNNKKKIAAAVLVGTVAVGGFFVADNIAKYTTTVTGEDTASVAKWAWSINSDNINSAETTSYTFDLFNTIKEADTTTAEADVTSGKIAPGTGGSFDLTITNNSEVNATYAIAFTQENNSNVPIQYCITGCDTDANWKSTISDIDITATNIDMGANSGAISVKWRWLFERGTSPYTSEDAADTALGFAANTTAPTVKVTAAATFTQRN